jgi:hypothetical protein
MSNVVFGAWILTHRPQYGVYNPSVLPVTAAKLHSLRCLTWRWEHTFASTNEPKLIKTAKFQVAIKGLKIGRAPNSNNVPSRTLNDIL